MFAGLILASLLLAAAGCGRIAAGRVDANSPDIAVTLQIQPEAAVAQRSSVLSVTLRDASAQAIDGATVTLEGNMTHAGMMPVNATATAAGNGVYRAPITWTMAGDWQITVKATLAEGRTVQRDFPLRVGGQ